MQAFGSNGNLMLQRFNYHRFIIRINTEHSLQLPTSTRNADPHTAVNKRQIYGMHSDFVVLPIAELANLLLLIVFFQTSGSSLAIIKLCSSLLLHFNFFFVFNFYIGVHGTDLREFTVLETKFPNFF